MIRHRPICDPQAPRLYDHPREHEPKPNPEGLTMPDLDTDVELYLHLADQIAVLTEQQKEIKARIAALGVGEHPCTKAKVVVRDPNRTFNLDRGWSMLAADQQVLCVSPDAKKVKAQLPEVLLEACMDPGKGDPVVMVKP